MRKIWMAAVVGGVLAGPAAAQSLNDAGRLLQQILPGQQQQQQPNQGQTDRDRAIYEQGRRDAEQARRGQGRNDGRDDGRYDSRRDDAHRDDRRRADDPSRYDRDQDRRRGDQDRPYDDGRPSRPGDRYQPSDNR